MDASHIIDMAACLHGRFYILKNDTYISRSMAAYGEWTEGEFDLFKGIFRPGDVAIDVGANIGCLSVPMAKAVGPGGAVYSFEPQPGLFRVLAANTMLNGALNTRLFHMACGSAPGEIQIAELLFDSPNNFGGFSLANLESNDASRPRRRVPIVRLDDVFDSASLRMIKIDVEGMEADVIRGAAGIIRQHRPCLYVENEMPEQSRAAIEAIQALDYRLYWHITPLFNPKNFRGNTANIFGEISCVNMFCVPAEGNVAVEGLTPVKSATEHPRAS